MKKILLIHGWNYRFYTKMTNEKNPWHNRMNLIQALENNYQLYYLNLPGFCGVTEPNKAWKLEDFAKYVNDYIATNHLAIDYILGYSFGGAVALFWKVKYQSSVPLILISPAIMRTANNSRTMLKTPAFLKPLRNKVRDWYVIKIKKTPEMVYGTPFLRNTYQNIVRINLVNELKTIAPQEILIIYGKKDEMVNPYMVNDALPKYLQKRIFFLDGDHNVGATNAQEIIELIAREG